MLLWVTFFKLAFPGGASGKEPTFQCRTQGTRVQSLGREDLREKEVATHTSILAWKVPWTEEPGRYSPWGHKESDTTELTHTPTSYDIGED